MKAMKAIGPLQNCSAGPLYRNGPARPNMTSDVYRLTILSSWWLTPRRTALTGLLLSIRRTGGAGFCEATIEQSLNQRATLLNRVATENLALHRLRRTAAMQTDDRIPATR